MDILQKNISLSESVAVSILSGILDCKKFTYSNFLLFVNKPANYLLTTVIPFFQMPVTQLQQISQSVSKHDNCASLSTPPGYINPCCVF